eukprot:7827685-Lingulodinium_polyedra.AAC.1
MAGLAAVTAVLPPNAMIYEDPGEERVRLRVKGQWPAPDERQPQAVGAVGGVAAAVGRHGLAVARRERRRVPVRARGGVAERWLAAWR